MANQTNTPMKIHDIHVQGGKKELRKYAQGIETEYLLLMTPDNESHCIEMEEPEADGTRYAIEDEEGNSIPLKYDAIRLYTGRKPDKDYVLIEVKDTYTELLVDEDNEPIILTEFSDDYFAEQVVYVLGNVIETTVEEIWELGDQNDDVSMVVDTLSMKCLAVRQPWAQLIVTGIKDIECRDAMPAPKKPKVFIAASGTKLRWDELGNEVQSIYRKYQEQGVLPPYDQLPTKCIVGFVDIVKASFDPVDSPWGSDWDGMKYTLRNAEVLDEPIYGKNKATPYFYNVEGYDENHLPKSHKAELK